MTAADPFRSRSGNHPGSLRRRTRQLTAPLRRRLGWVVWGIGVGVYALAVFHRTSLGVAGPMAEARFSLNAAQLSSFVMLQLAVYAAMQIPAGILIDRFGPRKVLFAATVTMGIAQLGFALVQTFPLALLARGMLGCGDAMTYISVLRIAAAWFPARRYPLLTAFTALVGTVGNLASTLPLTVLLGHFGWTATFAVAGSLSLGYGVLLLRPATRAPMRQAAARTADSPVAGHRILAEVRAAWRMPAGRLGFWVHLTTMAGPNIFGVLWGFPYLTEGLGYSSSRASSLLMTMVAVSSVASIVVGLVVTRSPAARTPIAMVVATACLAGWVVLIGYPGGNPPLAVIVAVIVVFATGGPVSAVAFLVARDYNPRHRISTATGMVNVGGWCGTMVGVYAVGQIIDWVDPAPVERSLASFRWGFVAVAALTAFGLTRVLTWWLRTRAEVLLASARGEDVPVRIIAHRWELVDTVLLAREAERARRIERLGHALRAQDLRLPGLRPGARAPETRAPETRPPDAEGDAGGPTTD